MQAEPILLPSETKAVLWVYRDSAGIHTLNCDVAVGWRLTEMEDRMNL